MDNVTGAAIRPGAAVMIRTATDEVLPAVAVTGVEPTHELGPTGRMRKIHDFPVVWVKVGSGGTVPWPAEDVWLAAQEGGRQTWT